MESQMKRSRLAAGLVALLVAGALVAPGAPGALAAHKRSHAGVIANGPLLIEDNGQSNVGGPLLYAVTPGQPRHSIGHAFYGNAYLESGAASPRGTYIALAEQLGGLWVLDATGAAPRRVVGATPSRIAIDVTAVAWSPDRFTLAYVRDTRNMGCGCGPMTPDTTPGDGLWVVPYDGSTAPRQILTSASLGTDGINGLSGWTPDGQAVIANTARGVEAISVPSGVRRMLALDAYGSLSPDGTQLALVTSTKATHNTSIQTLTIRNIASGQTRILARTNVYLGVPHWASDGTQIAYTWSPPGTFPNTPIDVHAFSLSTGQVRTIYRQPHDEAETSLVAWLSAPQ